MVKKVVEGYHATVFAYGQTGSGKTFTMEGYEYQQAQKQGDRHNQAPIIDPNSQNIGITQRAVNDLFKEIRRSKEEDGKHISIFVSFLQIYNERVYDLLNAHSLNSKSGSTSHRGTGLRIRWTK